MGTMQNKISKTSCKTAKLESYTLSLQLSMSYSRSCLSSSQVHRSGFRLCAMLWILHRRGADRSTRRRQCCCSASCTSDRAPWYCVDLPHDALVSITPDHHPQRRILHLRNIPESTATLHWVTDLRAVALAHGLLAR